MFPMTGSGETGRGRPVLVADDDANLRASVRSALERDGFSVLEASDGVEAKTALLPALGRPDLVVLDISMPRLNGLDLVRELRASGDAVPIIFLTSRDEELDRVLGLELGADDYLPKPFSLRELVARVRAVLRRSEIRLSATAGSSDARAALRREPSLVKGAGASASLGLDREAFQAFWASAELDLTVTEFRILDCLIESPGAARSREALIAASYPEGVYLSDRVVDCHIKRIRRKLREAGAGDDLIETVYGFGYRLRS
jgi:DNA-binding response OmpR family regulator